MDLRLALLLAVSACAGCWTNPFGLFGSSTGGDKLASFDGYLSLQHGDWCDLCARCNSVGRSEVAECASRLDASTRTLYGTALVQDAIAAGRITYDKQAAIDCLDEQEARSCDPVFAPADNDPCDRVLQGQVIVGGVCHSSLECRSGWCADARGRDSWGCAGTCTAFVAPGGPCDADAGRRCDDNHHVRCDGTSKVCVAQGGRGAACEQPIDCWLGLDCQRGRCTDYLFPTGFYDHAEGEACGSVATCFQGLSCIGLDTAMVDGKSTVVPGTCRPTLDKGDPCDPAVLGTGCPSDMACDATRRTCQPWGHLGQPCREGQCSDLDGLLFCDAATTTCRQRPVPDEPCDPAQQACRVGSCDPASRKCSLMCL